MSKIYLNNIKLLPNQFPSWESMNIMHWKEMLRTLFFKSSDSFAFSGVYKKSDLFPLGLYYFENWELNEIDLVEQQDDIICRFELNENCKKHLMSLEFAVHSNNFEIPIDNSEYETDVYFYEFDILHFYNGDILEGTYTNHENEIEFYTKYNFDHLSLPITKSIIEKRTFNNHIKMISEVK